MVAAAARARFPAANRRTTTTGDFSAYAAATALIHVQRAGAIGDGATLTIVIRAEASAHLQNRRRLVRQRIERRMSFCSMMMMRKKGEARAPRGCRRSGGRRGRETEIRCSHGVSHKLFSRWSGALFRQLAFMLWTKPLVKCTKRAQQRGASKTITLDRYDLMLLIAAAQRQHNQSRHLGQPLASQIGRRLQRLGGN